MKPAESPNITSDGQYCYVGETQHNNADQDCFKTLILQETLKTQKINIRRNSVHFRKSHVCANK